MFKRLLALASILTCALTTVGAHALEPAVYFVGGNVMYNWANTGPLQDTLGNSPFYPIFINGSFQLNDGPGICHETDQAQAVVNQNLPMYENFVAVHLMVGADDVMGIDDANPPSFVFGEWQGCYTALVNSILAAHRKVILGTIPFTLFGDPKPYNDFIFSLASQKGLAVIDYYTLLRRANENFEGVQYWIPASGTNLPSITTQGYQLMSLVASSVADQVVNGVTLKSGFLGVDTEQFIGDPPYQVASGLNTVVTGSKMHWLPYEKWSDNTTLPLLNYNEDHINGYWTSSNSNVVKVDAYGTAYALAPGTTKIKFTTLSGATLNEWDETVTSVGHP
jgi:hypothetical protein